LHLPFLSGKEFSLADSLGERRITNKDKNKKFLVSFCNVKDSEAGGCVRRQWVLLFP
jgi:hypothetical protein